MLSFAFSPLAAIISAFTFASNVAQSPLDATAFAGLDTTAQGILEASTKVSTAAPHFVVYSDQYISGLTGPPPVAQVKGWNVFALSFLLTEGAYDKAEEWTQLTAAQRSTVKAQYKAAGISLIVSLFGSTDVPTSSGADPVKTAQTMAAWVKKYSLDGVDVDYEDFGAMDARDGSAENWLISFTKALRVELPVGQYILTHAPVAPWFSPTQYSSGAYLKVDKAVGSQIDWYNVQFYNQGAKEYTTCAGLLTTSSSAWPNTSLFQIAASGVPKNKLVIGKPGGPGSATNGYMTPAALAKCAAQAKAKGWSGGIMAWEFPAASSSWITTVRGAAFPL
ncbi:glycoside hydrolase family 18 protein [Athelia psychrophila]|uniref:Glycoside hydrolase family 18 protein n=1 Tax=Athelia psychrophila TaxID=1759441 RepID=A0A166F9M1_9AGAM|nr:glycoside hydrolase family 18 protein [Fibularhizoctonia sp. CBS 109695]